MHCHTSEKGPLFKLGGDTSKLPLPWSDEEFERGETGRNLSTLDEEDDMGAGALFAELIRGATIW